MDTELTHEIAPPLKQIPVRLKPEKPGDIGRHVGVPLRNYAVIRRHGRRDEFIFSTVSTFALELMGAINADPFGLRPDWTRYTSAEA